MLKKDKIHIFTPQKNNTQKIALTRKYSLRKANLLKFIESINGVKIKGSNTTYEKSLCTVNITDIKQFETININSDIGYKYIRFQAPMDKRLQLAEIHFFDKKNNEILFDTIYSDGKPNKNINLYRLENCYDNNPISFFETSSLGSSIFFKSNKNIFVNKIIITPRNDDNFIKKNELYELFYNDGKNGWISLGEQIGTTTEVLYYNSPKNAVLWLKNKTKGKEEQIFTYENNRQIFPTFEEYGK